MAISTSDDRLAQSGIFLADRGEPVTAAQRVYDDLRRRIVNLELPPGTTLSRVELTRQYEVSQTPLREAMQRLEQDGLIDIFPQSRTVVTKIDSAQLYEAHFLRVAVEAEVVRRLARAPDPAVIKKARAILTLQEALADNLDEIGMFNELDEAFHQTLFGAVGQLNLHRMLKAKAGHLARARRLDLPKGGKIRAILNSHRAIVDAIEAGDGLAAQDAMRDHLAGTVGRIEALQREHPDHFKVMT
jgi:DNA-binding GntR family transcriptional regulator